MRVLSLTCPRFEPNPVMTFLWCPIEKTYFFLESGVPNKTDYRNWKWSRHFLTKCQGLGHWMMEASAPEPVVMLLQMMRYFRMGWPPVSEEDDKKGQERKGSDSSVSQDKQAGEAGL